MSVRTGADYASDGGTGRTRAWLMAATSSAVGLAIAGFDRWADKGEISPGAVLLLLFIACVSLGAMAPVRPWRWAVCAALWLPVTLVAAHAFGVADHVRPDTVTARALVLAPALAVALIGAYAGAGAARACVRRR
jgi:hypothetical protein